MAEFLQSNIKFSANNLLLNNAGQKRVKFGNSQNEDFSEEVLNDNKQQYSDTLDGVLPFVNAVEIDWNGAQIGESRLFKACSKL